MTLDQYFKSLDSDARHDFCDRVGSNYAYLRHVAKGRKNCGPLMALAIERESGGEVKSAELRPEIFGSAA